jgi:hypothetical protein
MSAFKKLPDGVDNFEIIRRNNLFYADKTELLHQLVIEFTPFFISRPRRFGKSLMLSTLEAILRGRRELFEGLWIHDHSDYDWTPKPVIHHLSSINTDSVTTVKTEILSKLEDIAKDENLEPNGNLPNSFFESMFHELHRKCDRKVAVLIDEYDYPILSNIAEPELAGEMQAFLTNFYGVLKDAEEHRGFTFITGSTKFTQLFRSASLNNLSDLTLRENCAGICGFTLKEFDSLFEMFGPKILAEFQSNGCLPQEAALGDLRTGILDWYDGYSWDGETRVLNPWSVLKFFTNMEFADYWFQSVNPTFLNNFVKKNYVNIHSFKNDPYIADSYNVVGIDQFVKKTMLFQTGYLTAKQVRKNAVPRRFYWGCPNLEVEAAIAKIFFSLENPFEETLLKRRQAKEALNFLISGDTSQFQTAFESILRDINYHLHVPNEAFFQTIFQFDLDLAGQICDSRTLFCDCRPDLHFRAPTGDDYVIELKYVPSPDGAAAENKKAAQTDKPAAKPKAKNPQPTSKRLQTEMNKEAQSIAAQIDLKKYVQQFHGSGHKVYKAALVIGGRSNALIVLEEAQNWSEKNSAADF